MRPRRCGGFLCQGNNGLLQRLKGCFQLIIDLDEMREIPCRQLRVRKGFGHEDFGGRNEFLANGFNNGAGLGHLVWQFQIMQRFDRLAETGRVLSHFGFDLGAFFRVCAFAQKQGIDHAGLDRVMHHVHGHFLFQDVGNVDLTLQAPARSATGCRHKWRPSRRP